MLHHSTCTTKNLIIKLIKNYEECSIHAALLQHWAKINEIPFSKFKQTNAAARFLTASHLSEVESIRRILSQSIFKLSIKDIERIFEVLIDSGRRKSQGAFYTPDFIIEYLVRHGLQLGNHRRKEAPLICDPACGSGGFLIRAAEILKDDISPDRAFAECLVGFDNDPWAIEHARCLIEIFLILHGFELSGIDLRLFCRDTLLCSHENLWNLSGAYNGFNLVTTNPPYVKLQNLDFEYRTRLAKKFNRYANGNFSLALLFLIAGHRLLRPQGCLAVITQNNLYTSFAGSGVRFYLQNQQCIRRIVDFGHYRVFKQANAYTCLVFLGTEKKACFEFVRIEGACVDSLRNATFSEILFSDLRADKWRLAKSNHLRNLEIIESTGKPLGTIASIKVGFATLKDSVFLVRIRDDQYCTANPMNQETHLVEIGLTRPAVKVANLNRAEDIEKNDLRIIFPYKRIEEKYRLMSEEDIKNRFPQGYSYLRKYRDFLESRDKGKKRYEGWYAWGRTQGMEAKGPKLLTKTFSRFPQFMLDRSDQLFCNGYSVTIKDDSLFRDKLTIEVLEKITNSRIMYYYAKLTSFQIEGNYQCYQKNFIERIGIVNMTEREMTTFIELPKLEADEYLEGLYGIKSKEIEEICGSALSSTSTVTNRSCADNSAPTPPPRTLYRTTASHSPRHIPSCNRVRSVRSA